MFDGLTKIKQRGLRIIVLQEGMPPRDTSLDIIGVAIQSPIKTAIVFLVLAARFVDTVPELFFVRVLKISRHIPTTASRQQHGRDENSENAGVDWSFVTHKELERNVL